MSRLLRSKLDAVNPVSPVSTDQSLPFLAPTTLHTARPRRSPHKPPIPLLMPASLPVLWPPHPAQASRGATWAERASALVFLQYFWFRHAFLLGPGGAGRVAALVTARLADAKLEVRELAAMTLSGERLMKRSKSVGSRAVSVLHFCACVYRRCGSWRR